VAQGLSNRQIGERLVIGERTVESHVSHMLTRLDLPSRARLAAWAVEQGLVPPERQAPHQP
jgi:DNA-binding NarL/FixJ family response regulator